MKFKTSGLLLALCGWFIQLSMLTAPLWGGSQLFNYADCRYLQPLAQQGALHQQHAHAALHQHATMAPAGPPVQAGKQHTHNSHDECLICLLLALDLPLYAALGAALVVIYASRLLWLPQSHYYFIITSFKRLLNPPSRAPPAVFAL